MDKVHRKDSARGAKEVCIEVINELKLERQLGEKR